MQNRNKQMQARPQVLLILGGTFILLAAMFALVKPQPVFAQQDGLNSAVAKYPVMSGSSIQSCNFCHVANSIPDLNPYGADYLARGRSTAAFGLIESLDSDGDGYTNLQEIQGLSFPGNSASVPSVATATPTRTPVPATATNTPTNTPVPATATNTPTNTPVPSTATSTPTNTPVPATATSTPTNTSVPATATNTPTNTPVGPTATHTATSTPTNTSVPATATNTPTNTPVGPTATHTPTNTPVPPTATNTPTNTPVPPTITPTVTPTSSVTPAPAGLDLDIKNFKVTSEIELKEVRPVRFRLEVKNSGKVDGQGSATLVGIQNGKEIYRKTITVFDLPGGGHTNFSFTSYTPRVGGKIIWVLTLKDDNADNDMSVRTTKVKAKHGHEDRHR